MKSVLLAIFVCTLALAQPKTDIQLPPNVRMYEPKNLTPDRAQRLGISIRNLLNNNVGLSWDDMLHAFVIKGDAKDMDAAEALLKRFDIAEPKVELTVYLVRAEPKIQEQIGIMTARPAPQGTPVPPEIQSAIAEMKSTFDYARYSLWDSIVLRPSDGGADEEGALLSDAGSYHYNLQCKAAFGSPVTESKTLNLPFFFFSLEMPVLMKGRAGGNPAQAAESHIHTELTIPEGKKIVLGRIHLLPAGAGDLFLVLATKVN